MKSQSDARVECLSYMPGAQPHLRLIGDVATILDARCAQETLHRLTAPSYALGGGAVGPSAEWALKHIGEFMCIDGRPVWTPSSTGRYTPQVEMKEATVYTPFLVEWDGTVNATFAFESQLGLDITTLYRRLFDEVKRLDRNLASGLIATIILAETTTEKVVDKVMIMSPMGENAPPNGRQIIHETNINHFFSWDVTRKRRLGSSQSESLESLITVGVGVDKLHANTGDLGDLLPKAFYATPGVGLSSSELVHNHAMVLSKNAIPLDLLCRRVHKGEIDLTKVAAQVLEAHSPNDILCMIHIENDTILHKGLVGVGIIARAGVMNNDFWQE